MNVIKMTKEEAMKLSPLVASFRVALKAFKGIKAQPNIEAGLEEIKEYLDAGFPIYAAEDEGKYIGYLVCRIEEPCVWVESIFVEETYRRSGTASLLLKQAEELAGFYGGDTLYFYVHPNNHRMIAFLRSHGYSVLNLIEVRRPHQGETLSQKIRVGDHDYDY